MFLPVSLSQSCPTQVSRQQTSFCSHSSVINRNSNAILESWSFLEWRFRFKVFYLPSREYQALSLFFHRSYLKAHICRSVLVYSIPYGGPVSLVWGWAVCSIFLMFIATAIAELGSAAPTSGGVYYWTFKFSSPKYRNYLSWLLGCMSSLSMSPAFLCVMMIQTLTLLHMLLGLL